MQTIEYKSGRGQQLHLNELEAIAEGVVYVKALEADNGVIFKDLDLVGFKAGAKRAHVHDANRRVGFGGGLEVFLGAYVKLVHSALQPYPAAVLQSRRLSEFGHAEDANKEFSCLSFAAGRGCELNVIDPEIEVHLPPAWR
jgi:hypothetical protein